VSFKRNDRVRHKHDATKGIGTIIKVAGRMATVQWEDGTTTISNLSDLKSK